jgi:hypothetical protein
MNPSIGGAAQGDFFGVSVDSMHNGKGDPFERPFFGILLFDQTRHFTERVGGSEAVAVFLDLHMKRTFIQHQEPLLRKSQIK